MLFLFEYIHVHVDTSVTGLFYELGGAGFSWLHLISCQCGGRRYFEFSYPLKGWRVVHLLRRVLKSVGGFLSKSKVRRPLQVGSFSGRGKGLVVLHQGYLLRV